MINSSLAPRLILVAIPVNAARPCDMAGEIVLLRPFFLQEGFRFAIIVLLLPVGSNRIASVVPDHRAGAISQGPPFLLKPPADIHIISRNAKLRIKSVYGFQSGFPKSHIASWNMFGFSVGQQYVDRISRRVGDALGYSPIARGGEVRSADH